MHRNQKKLVTPRTDVLSWIRWVRALVIAVVLFLSILIFNLLQLSSLVILPFSQSAFRRSNRFLAGTWWGWCAFACEKICKTEFVLSGDEIPEQENALVVANHQAMSDIVVLTMLATRKGRLSDLKWFVKEALKFVPGMWGMLFLDCLFIKRNWASDEGTIKETFSTFKKYRIPIWLVSFSEGTRLTQKKLVASQEFSRGRGSTVLEHVLIPRTKGFDASVRGLNDYVTAVYDLTIAYQGGVPNLWQLCEGRPKRIFLDVRRFGIEMLPRDSAGISAWLVERFNAKDEFLKRVHGAAS